MTVPLAVLGFRGAGRYHSDIVRVKRSSSELSSLLHLIRQVSARGSSVFLERHELSRSLQFSFDLENGQDLSAAAAAKVLDDRVRQACEELVPDQIDEQNLFFNYFSHVTALLSKLFAREKDFSDAIIQAQNSIRAMIRVQDAAPLMAYACFSRFSFSSTISSVSCGIEEGKETKVNKIVEVAMKLLEPIIIRYEISKADVLTLAGCIAIEELGGPKIAWREGRVDDEESECYVDVDTYFSPQEKVVLKWLESCETAAAASVAVVAENGSSENTSIASSTPLQQPPASPVRKGHLAGKRISFDNGFFEDLVLSESMVKSTPPSSPIHSQQQYNQEEWSRPWIELYAGDETRFIQDFTFAFTKLQEWKFRFPCKSCASKQSNSKEASAANGVHTTSESDSGSLEEEDPLLFKLPESLAMFHFSAAMALPITREWRTIVQDKPEHVLQSVRNLTKYNLAMERLGSYKSSSTEALEESRSRSSSNASVSSLASTSGAAKVNLSVFRAPHPETSSEFVFDLDDSNDRTAAIFASKVDPVINKFKPSLVPKISEADFYYNYFSHVYHLRKQLSRRDKPKVVKVFVGSTNPVKVNACKRAFLAAFQGQNNKVFEFHGVNAPSGVSDQPMGDQETKQGAINRALHCQKLRSNQAPKGANTEFYIGVEGGIVEECASEGDLFQQNEMLCCAWIAILTNTNALNCARTATFNLPPSLASLVRKGIELGRADDIVHGTTNSKQKGGTVGTLTQGLIDRTQYYKHAVILAVAPFSNPTFHF